MAPIPSLWDRGLDLDTFIDTPMHLLFLGIAKAIFLMIGVWSSRCGRSTAFNELATNKLKSLEDLKLQWLTFNVSTFDSWGGWVSEKYQSLSRVALWIYGPLIEIDDVPPFVPPTDRTIDQWLVDHYRKWLQVRGLPWKGTKNQLREKVVTLMNLPENEQPKLLPPKYGSADGVMQVLRTMVIMFTTFLQQGIQGESHARILALRVRMFLSAVEEMESHIRPKMLRKEYKRYKTVDGKKVAYTEVKHVKPMPLWLSKFNFLSLLNLPDLIKKYGSPRNYFEGKYLGERYVQEVKDV
jgi:hypothetical protein